ncbi:MAG: hypothetical protein GY805_31745 [Chloroflexi bacterium]|nr:hypothetical protein [Chloroflexota bacterium]
MKFNPTFLEFLVFFLTRLSLYVWSKYGRRIRRWLQDYFRRRRGQPKAPSNCPECSQAFSRLPLRSKPELPLG